MPPGETVIQGRPARPVRAALAILTALLCTAGCGDKNRGTVRGRVTLDGEPVAQGSIIFIPGQQGQGKPTGGPITDGMYHLAGDAAPAVGLNRVEIRANRKSGRMIPKPFSPPGEMMEVPEEAVAAKYNDESTLEFEVKPGNNEANWEVESRK